MMVAQPAYLKNLKVYARALDVGVDGVATLEVFEKESDRGAVILAASRIEDFLEWALRKKMPNLKAHKATSDALFGHSGILGSFSNKNDIAYGLAIIDRPTWTEINLVREMRNACAHSRRPLSFASPELAAVCLQLAHEMFPDPSLATQKTLRSAFLVKMITIQQAIMRGHHLPYSAILKERDQRPKQSDRGDPG